MFILARGVPSAAPREKKGLQPGHDSSWAADRYSVCRNKPAFAQEVPSLTRTRGSHFGSSRLAPVLRVLQIRATGTSPNAEMSSTRLTKMTRSTRQVPSPQVPDRSLAYPRFHLADSNILASTEFLCLIFRLTPLLSLPDKPGYLLPFPSHRRRHH